MATVSFGVTPGEPGASGLARAPGMLVIGCAAIVQALKNVAVEALAAPAAAGFSNALRMGVHGVSQRVTETAPDFLFVAGRRAIMAAAHEFEIGVVKRVGWNGHATAQPRIIQVRRVLAVSP